MKGVSMLPNFILFFMYGVAGCLNLYAFLLCVKDYKNCDTISKVYGFGNLLLFFVFAYLISLI